MSDARDAVDGEIKDLLAAVHTTPHKKIDLLRAIAESLVRVHKPASLETAVNVFRQQYGGYYESLNNNESALLRNLCLLRIHYAIELQVEPESYLANIFNSRVIKAGDAFHYPKHVLQRVAKLVREKTGAGRSVGGGRRGSARCATPRGMSKFRSEFEDNLPYITQDDEFMERLSRLVAVYHSIAED